MAAAFSGEPTTLWLTEKGSDRGMELTEAFWFRDGAGRQWDAAKGTRIDGASIPRALWTSVGSPYTGDYRRASVVHDVACVAAGPGDSPARREADRMFYEACKAGGCSVRDSIILYVGVRIGAWYGRALIEQEDDGPRITRTRLEKDLRSDFRDTAELVLSRDPVDDAEEVERRTDAAFSAVVARRLAAAEAVTMAAAGLQR